MAKQPTNLWCVSVPVSAQAEEPVVALLERLLAEPPTVYVDAETGERRASVYIPQPLGPRRRRRLTEGLTAIRDLGLPLDPPYVQCKRVRRRDWAQAWKKHFHPIRIARRLIVKPSWSPVTRGAGEVVITLDPGLAFGTGHHPTTAYCLAEIVRHRPRHSHQSKSFLDVGTGSGILAIAAAKFGYRPVAAFDMAADSVQIAGANLRRNRVAPRVVLECADVRDWSAPAGGGYDLVCANLISDLLCEHRRRLRRQLLPGGRLVAAGILADQFEEARRAYEGLGMELDRTQRSGEWQCGTFRRP